LYLDRNLFITQRVAQSFDHAIAEGDESSPRRRLSLGGAEPSDQRWHVLDEPRIAHASKGGAPHTDLVVLDEGCQQLIEIRGVRPRP